MSGLHQGDKTWDPSKCVGRQSGTCFFPAKVTGSSQLGRRYSIRLPRNSLHGRLRGVGIPPYTPPLSFFPHLLISALAGWLDWLYWINREGGLSDEGPSWILSLYSLGPPSLQPVYNPNWAVMMSFRHFHLLGDGQGEAPSWKPRVVILGGLF